MTDPDSAAAGQAAHAVVGAGQAGRPGEVIATISSLLPSLLPTEQAVARVLLERSAEIVELSSQQVAELAGASRATVVRTCQSLGFTGYQQLRVLLARDAGYAAVPSSSHSGAGGAAGAGAEVGVGVAGLVGDAFRRVATGVASMVALLDEASLDSAIAKLADARRVVVLGNGLSSPLALDAAARLTAVGRLAEAPLDVIHQQITARLLSSADVVLAISGSGSNASTLRAVQAARAAEAPVIAVTAFARTPLAALADLELVVTMPDLTFRDEVTQVTRIPQAILVEGLVAAVAARLGDAAVAARNLALDQISENLAE
jgi:RpiR family transcriptional regulator, carbohydrate utilization regulator